MNRIKIIFSTLILILNIMQVYAQSFQLKDLIGKTWVGVSGYNGCEYIDWTVIFSEKSSEHKFAKKTDNEQLSLFSYNMYLCNELPIKYDEILLGKNNSGKYIVFERISDYKGKQIEDFHIFEIVSLTADTLIVKSNDLTITFEAK